MTSSVRVVGAPPALDAVAAAHCALDELGEARLWAMSAHDIATLVIELERLARRVGAAQTAAVAQADTVGVASAEGASSTAAWLREVTDTPIGVGRSRLALREALGRRRAVARAFESGNISGSAASAVCTALDTFPPEVPAALVAPVEVLLIEVGHIEGTRGVVRRAAEIAHRFAPDHLADLEARHVERRSLTLTTHHDGTVRLRGRLDAEAGAAVLATLGPLAAPVPAVGGVPDMRFAGQRWADALVRACRLAAASSPGTRGERPTLLVTIGLDALVGKLGQAPGVAETGAPISAEAARRLACDARVIPVVLGGASEPLDVGRSAYVVPQPMRRALVARDSGCAFPSCDRPHSWCDAHHIIPWANGGAIAIANLVLLCGHHHRVVHDRGWRIILRGAQPWFSPPRWIDVDQTPRLNARYRIRDIDP